MNGVLTWITMDKAGKEIFGLVCFTHGNDDLMIVAYPWLYIISEKILVSSTDTLLESIPCSLMYSKLSIRWPRMTI